MSISCDDNNLKLWNVNTWECIVDIKNISCNGFLYSACFLADNIQDINFSYVYNKSISSTYKCEKKKDIFSIEIFNEAEVFSDNISFIVNNKKIDNNLRFLLIDNIFKTIYTPGLIG